MLLEVRFDFRCREFFSVSLGGAKFSERSGESPSGNVELKPEPGAAVAKELPRRGKTAGKVRAEETMRTHRLTDSRLSLLAVFWA